MTELDPTTALDAVQPVHVEVGYGALGTRGSLGYESKRVVVGGEEHASALSTHPPARVAFDLGGRASQFSCRVALNDDVAAGASYADFTVLADGRRVAEAIGVRSGEGARALVADLRGARLLELVVTTGAWEYSHAVWIEPLIEPASEVAAGDTVITDPLERADITVPSALEPTEQCIATVVSRGFEQWADDLLCSIAAFGGCPAARTVLFTLDDDPAATALADKHGALLVRCRARVGPNPTSKAVMYAAAHVVPAARFVCLDADMLVLADLGSVFAALDLLPPDTVLVAREGNDHGLRDLTTALDLAYGGGPDPPFFARNGPLGAHPLVVNDGLFAGTRRALLTLDAAVRSLPAAVEWVDGRRDIAWRNQFVFNVALAQALNAVELDPVWNLQLHAQDIEPDLETARPRARWRGREVRVVHFSGAGKSRHAELRAAVRAAADRFARARDDPMALAACGRIEEAREAAHMAADVDPDDEAVAALVAQLDAALAAPIIGPTDPRERRYTSDAPRPFLLRMQQALHHSRYRGRQLVKSPFDLALSLRLFEQLRPRTVIEIGSKDGGSALWFADLLERLGIDGAVHSFDLVAPEAVEHPRVTFHSGDGRNLAAVIDENFLAGCPPPMLVIDDADHDERTTAAILDFFHPRLKAGDYLVVEDGNLTDLYPHAFGGGLSGPHRAIRRFVAEHAGEYEVDATLCDFYGYNVTTASNGILRRVAASSVDDIEMSRERLRGRPWRQAAAPASVHLTPSMLSPTERDLLHWLARHHFAGFGRIVDGGSFLGGSTVALASGLAARPDGPWLGAIASYDLFRVEEYALPSFGSCFTTPAVGASFRDDFDRMVGAYSGLVEVREGDVSTIGWTGEPIEILFLDMVKTWDVHDVVLREFMPCLVPGRSVVIQQDYLWGYGPWIHITMELLAGSVEILDSMPNGSVVYLVTDTLPDEVLGLDLRRDVPAAEMRRLMDRAVDRWEGDEQGLVELARVMLVAELEGPDAARIKLAEVRARHAGEPRVEHCAAIVGPYVGG